MKNAVYCAVSGHGFGHLSQVAPILNRLGPMVSGRRIVVAGHLDEGVVRNFIQVPHFFDFGARDIGLVQSDPMVANLAATRICYERLQRDWEGRVTAEMERLRFWSADLVIVDIPCVTIAAAYRLGIPSVAIASLSWDHILKGCFSLEDAEVREWWRRMRETYSRTTLALHPEPAILGDTFPRYAVIPPLVSQARGRRDELRRTLGISRKDDRPLIMINLGGMPSQTVPIGKIVLETRYHWLFKETVSSHPEGHVHGTPELSDWPFEDIQASVDMVVGKPGYGTAIETAARGIPLLYVRRGWFPDEEPICQWLSSHSRASEIGADLFSSGQWHDAITSLFSLAPRPLPRCDGAKVAVARILELLDEI
ncbi:MAG: hypothetical protein HQL76_15850 [Magnetococcales bacterium]|nr:hypothetical protein [Magnetococcales bacterium]